MIKCIIIDDEEKARNGFSKIIERYFSEKLKLVAMAGSVKQGVEEIYRHSPELVFLDIEMPVENGFKLFEYFKKYDFDVIFTTAHNHYAIDAIKHAALDYLLKPINFIDLKDALQRFEEKQKNPSQNLRMKAMMSNLLNGTLINQKVALPTMDGFRLIKLNEIIYCEASESYCFIHITGEEKIVVPKTLKSIEMMLSNKIFHRIHKSFLVNLNYVERFVKVDGCFVVLEDGTELDVALRRKESFIEALKNQSFHNE